MSTNLPDELVNLDANAGIYAVWMIFQHLGIDPDIEQLKSVCGYMDGDGTTTIGLAVGLKKFGFQVEFSTDHDPELQPQEIVSYQEAESLNLPVLPVMSFEEIQAAFDAQKFVIVYYDSLDGVGNHSLVYDITETEISFFDSFEPMTKATFEQQRAVEGVCRQVITVQVNS